MKKALRIPILTVLLCTAVAFAQTPLVATRLPDGNWQYAPEAVHPAIPLIRFATVVADTDHDFALTPGTINCGRVSSPLYCWGIPVTLNGSPAGSLWLDTYLTGHNAGSGFIVWYGVADLAEATVKSNSVVNGTFTSGQYTLTAPASVTTTFSGDTNDGDGGSYTGTLTLNFTYYYSSGGGGRGGGGAGWRFICTGGAVSIQYQ